MLAYRNRPKKLDGLQLLQIPVPKPKPDEVLIKVEAVGLNFRDLRMAEGSYSFKYKPDTIIGSDCCGVVVDVGHLVDEQWLNKVVIVNPIQNWGDDLETPSGDFSILGTPNDGVFCEYFAINVNRIIEKPTHLSIEEAAVLPLAGLTAYRAIFTKGRIISGETILITGASGGVAQLVILLALAAGAKVYVTSGTEEKIERAKSLGAFDGANYQKDDLGHFFGSRNLTFDCIIDSAGGEQINGLLPLIKPSGKLVLYGAMNGKPSSFDLFTLYYNQLQIYGTLVGNDSEFADMINFVSAHQIRPIVDSVFRFTDIQLAFEKLKNKTHFGKIVLKL